MAEVYRVTPEQRGFIEFPRELPGVIAIFIVSAFSFIDDIRLAIASQFLAALGALALGFFTPPYAVMLLFIFINSLGSHLYMPHSDGIGVSLINLTNAPSGKRIGQYGAIKTTFAMFAAITVIFGFQSGVFSFDTEIKLVFAAGAFSLIVGMILLIILRKKMHGSSIRQKKRVSFLFKKEYTYYYLLAVLHGVQKQVMMVYGPWVLVTMLMKKADYMSFLNMAGSLIGIFFIQFLGRLIDKIGLRKILLFDAISFIIVYLIYAFFAYAFTTNIIATVGIPAVITSVIFILDKVSMQMGIVRLAYLKNIVEDPADITAIVTNGLSLDHIVSIACASIGGIIWANWGPHYVFLIVALISLLNVVVALKAPLNKL